MGVHEPVTTLEELDTLADDEILVGYLLTKKGDPEPGGNHTRSFHHGWRMRMMDYGEMQIPAEHREMTRQYVQRERKRSN